MRTHNRNSAWAIARRAEKQAKREAVASRLLRLSTPASRDEFRREFTTPPSRHAAKAGKITARFMREHPLIKSFVPPDYAYRAAGLR